MWRFAFFLPERPHLKWINIKSWAQGHFLSGGSNLESLIGLPHWMIMSTIGQTLNRNGHLLHILKTTILPFMKDWSLIWRPEIIFTYYVDECSSQKTSDADEVYVNVIFNQFVNSNTKCIDTIQICCGNLCGRMSKSHVCQSGQAIHQRPNHCINHIGRSSIYWTNQICPKKEHLCPFCVI